MVNAFLLILWSFGISYVRPFLGRMAASGSVPWSTSLAKNALICAFDEDHLFVAVNLLQLDLDDLAVGGLYMAAHEAGLDGQLAMAAIDQHQQLYAPRPAMIKERVQGGPYGTAGGENVGDENNIAAGDIEADGPRDDDRANIARRKVVAVEVNIEDAGIDRLLRDASNQMPQANGKRHAATLDADQPQVMGSIIFLNDLVRQPNQRALDFRCRHDAGLLPQSRHCTDLCFAHKCSGRMIRGLERFCHYGGVIRCPGFPCGERAGGHPGRPRWRRRE